MKKTTTILAIGSGLLLSHAQAEIESEFHVGYNSEYIFRGVDNGNDAFEYGLNLAGSCDCGLDWSAGVWHISPDQGGRVDDELNVYAAVSKDLGFATAALGFTNYQYDGAADDSEVFLGFSGDFAGISGGLTAFFGTDGALQDQILLEGDLGYAIEINDKTTVNFGLTYGYILEDGKVGTRPQYAAGNGKAYFSASVSADIALSDDITLSPYVSFVEAYDQNIAAANVQDGFVSGAKISFSF